MTEEEYFRKNYPDSCYGDKPLSPHWDFFQDGVEFGERQSETKIAELEAKYYSVSEIAHHRGMCCISALRENRELEKENAELKAELNSQIQADNWLGYKIADDLEEAKELLNKWYKQYSDKTYTETFYQDLLRATEKFLWSEVEK